MATITQIIETEKENYDRIHLYREGLFLKAYQHSAFLFHYNIKNFRAVKKYYKSTGCDVVMLGFPSSRLNILFPGAEPKETEDGHVCFPCSAMQNTDAFGEWFAAVERSPEKKKRQKQEIGNDYLDFDNAVISGGNDARDKVLRELEIFDVGNATPIECMVFVGRLKSELKKGLSGGL